MASVFLSHSSRDKPFVRELYRRLQRDGVTCFYDEESIGWGANFVRALEQGIDECEYFVVVLSPDFLASKWAEIERTSAMADDPVGLKRKILPLMLVPCRDDPGFPRFLRPIQAIDISTQESRERNYPRICEGLGGTLHEDWEEPQDHRSLPAVAVELPRDSAMPHRSLGERFVGRVTALWDIVFQEEGRELINNCPLSRLLPVARSYQIHLLCYSKRGNATGVHHNRHLDHCSCCA